MSELKPCPFCGCDPHATSKYIIGYPVRVSCKNINCRLGQITGTFTIEAWNTRHIPEGYALVPVEPTLLMLERGQGPKGYTMDGYPNAHSLADKWKAMVQAAQEKNEC